MGVKCIWKRGRLRSGSAFVAGICTSVWPKIAHSTFLGPSFSDQSAPLCLLVVGLLCWRSAVLAGSGVRIARLFKPDGRFSLTSR